MVDIGRSDKLGVPRPDKGLLFKPEDEPECEPGASDGGNEGDCTLMRGGVSYLFGATTKEGDRMLWVAEKEAGVEARVSAFSPVFHHSKQADAFELIMLTMIKTTYNIPSL